MTGILSKYLLRGGARAIFAKILRIPLRGKISIIEVRFFFATMLWYCKRRTLS